MKTMTAEQLHILQHSLGVDQHGQGKMYRNHYVGDGTKCRSLVELGFMIERPASEMTGGDPLFHVTEAGKQAVRDQSPPPPVLTAGQKRYREFLNADSGMRFGEWLKRKAKNAHLSRDTENPFNMESYV